MPDTSLTEGDLRNLRVIVSRAQANGLEEAKVVVILSAKLEAMSREMEAARAQDAD